MKRRKFGPCAHFYLSLLSNQLNNEDMNRKLFVMMSFLLIVFSAGCSSEENEDLLNGGLNVTISDTINIVGTWELKTLSYSGAAYEIQLDQRDIFEFCSNGQVKVIKKSRTSFPDFPNEDGEYDYSYNNEKRTILLCGKNRECFISDGIMYLGSGYASPYSEPIDYYVFIKK